MTRWFRFLGPAAVLFLWFLCTVTGLVSPLFLPSPVEVFHSLISLLVSGRLAKDILWTSYRMFVGFGISVIIGLPLGLVMGYSRSAYASLEFLVDFLRSIPALALFPLFMLVLGIGDTAKIGIAVFACALVILINTMYGVRTANKTRLKAARTLGVKGIGIFNRVIVWEAMPSISAGLRLSISMALLVVVVTEMFIGTELGLGQRIYNAHLIYRIPEMYAAIIITGLLGYSVNKIFIFAEKRIVHWAGK